MEEGLKLDFKFEIHLQRLCLIKVAVSLWERKEIREKICVFFEELSSKEDDILIRNWKFDLTKKVLSLMNNLPLPNFLINTLKHYVSSMGFQIYQWTKFVTKNLGFNIVCTDYIFWTHYGTIDKIQTFKYWYDHRILETSQLFNVACIFCLEDYVPILWNEIPDEVRKNDFYLKKIYTFSIYSLIIYWKKRLGEEIEENFVSFIHSEEWEKILTLRRAGLLKRDENYHRKMSWLEFCHESFSIEENMYRGAIIEGQELAVQYFWNNLDERCQMRDFEDIMLAIDREKNERGYSDILIFMMTRLKINKALPILYSHSLWETLLRNFPFEEFFIMALDRALELNKDYGILENKFFWSLVGTILNRIDDERLLFDAGDVSVYEKILQDMWDIIPESARYWVAQNPSFYIQRGLRRRGLC
ncbi:uncharacterized protein LOC117173328 [Belonocnema kinseyi]|uniref:uncharacterized protein LOC117173328 n=1 Tax=Belonocnema kinseyi TaxID=2817044 RepID=UPI00143CC16C|nr:uncharacterized protein LOC117173328 [Belonocnema kinseyi]